MPAIIVTLDQYLELKQQRDKLVVGLSKIARDCGNDPAAILAKELIAECEAGNEIKKGIHDCIAINDGKDWSTMIEADNES